MSRLTVFCVMVATLLGSAAWAQNVDGAVGSASPGDVVYGALSPITSSRFGINSPEFGQPKISLRAGDRQRHRYRQLRVGSWLVTPSLLVGGNFDSNGRNAARVKKSKWGLRVRPSVVAVRQTGVHQTTMFLQGDGTVNPGSNAPSIQANIGLIHLWELEHNIVARFAAQYTRSMMFIPVFKI